jgi:Mu transposase-like protein
VFCERVNTREHRVTRRPPAVMLLEERERMHPLPKVPPTVCFGQTRKVSPDSTISVNSAIYSVPATLVTEQVWARAHGSEMIVVHVDSPQGPREVARHALTTPGSPSIKDEHYPPRPAGALARTPRARSREEAAFLALGPGAEQWLIRAAAEGATRVRRKMAEAVDLAKLHGAGEVEHALNVCAQAGRFADGDVAAILAHEQAGTVIPFPARACEEQSLQRSTRSWEGFGR